MRVLTDELGAQAVIDLKRVMGTAETQERAEEAWRVMDAETRQATHRLHVAICDGFADPQFVELTELKVTKAGMLLYKLEAESKALLK